MSTNMELITSVTVGSGGAASVTLPATGTIPATYTDLKVMLSVRSTATGVVSNMPITFNGSTSGYSERAIQGDGSTAASINRSSSNIGYNYSNGGGSTSNTFSNIEVYIPNYAGSNYKSVSIDCANETNATGGILTMDAALWSNTAAITTITFDGDGFNFVEGSTFYLYGISNVTSTTKATGGIVSSDGTYNYHMFPYSGTFTPTEAISADVLVIAGGGGGGASGGGGAGGLNYLTSQSLTTTGYTVTIGAGGAGSFNTATATGTAGGNSVFNSNTATGGGGGAGGDPGKLAGGNGGSGGGAGIQQGNTTGTASGGTATSGQGNAGGSISGISRAGAGGGGAGAVGGNAGNSTGGSGGVGSVTYLSWATATGTGVNNGYYAGGGGGYGETTVGSSSLGGGGRGGDGGTVGTAGTVNTGGGGGGYGGAGGSGLVIIRYAI